MALLKGLQAIRAEQWVYVLAAANSIVLLTLLYVVKTPFRFGIW